MANDNVKRKMILPLFFIMMTITMAVVDLFHQEGKKIQHENTVKQKEMLLKSQTRELEFSIIRIRNDIADQIFDDLISKVLIREAQQETLDIIAEIVDMVHLIYGDRMSVLEDELNRIVKGEEGEFPILELIGNTIEGRSLNGIIGDAADNNDPIIMLLKLLVVDLSLNCATGSPTRTIEVEVAQQFAKVLAQNALDDITRRRRAMTLWHFLPVSNSLPWYSYIKNMNSTDLRDLKRMFLEFGADLEFLRGFEILVVERIYHNTDIFGNRIISPTGVFQPNLQLHIIQGFNIIDQLEHESKSEYRNSIMSKYNIIRDIEEDMIRLEREYRKFVMDSETELQLSRMVRLLVLTIMFICMFVLFLFVNVHIKAHYKEREE